MVCPSSVPLQGLGSGSLAFSASSFALTVAGRAFEVFPSIARTTEAVRSSRGPCSTALPVGYFPRTRPESLLPAPLDHLASCEFTRHRHLAPPPHPATTARVMPAHERICSAVSCLLEGPLRRSSSLLVHSRGAAKAKPRRPACANMPVSFRPRGFSPPRRFTPSLPVCALFQRTPDRGVHRVSSLAPPASDLPKQTSQSVARIPRDASLPLEDAP